MTSTDAERGPVPPRVLVLLDGRRLYNGVAPRAPVLDDALRAPESGAVDPECHVLVFASSASAHPMAAR